MGPILEIKVVWLLIVVASVAMAVRWIRFPYTIALVIIGLVLGFFHVITGISLTPDLIFFVFLPALLFEAAFHLNITDLRRNVWPITLLAVPGVLITVVVAGFLITKGIGLLYPSLAFPIGYGLLFGALISATDPISVLAIFKRLGISRKLSVIIEGESLFNDGTAVVVFSIILVFLTKGDFTVMDGIARFFIVVAGGIGIGLMLGLVMSIVTAQVDDYLIEITLTTILAYGSYLLAEEIHVSGVIAVVSAGIMSGNFGTRYGMSPTTKLAVSSFWEYVCFMVNSVVFILIGIEITVANLVDWFVPILIAWGAVLVSRTMAVSLTWPFLRIAGGPHSRRWSAVLVWGGLRGSLAMVLVLSLPKDFPYRDLILSMTFGVVFMTLIVQGMSMKMVIDRLKLAGIAEEMRDYERYRGRLIAIAGATAELKRMIADGMISKENHDRLLAGYRKKERHLTGQINALHLSKGFVREAEAVSAKKHLLEVEKDSIRTAFAQGIISGQTMGEIVGEVDAEIIKIDEDKT